MKNLKLSVKLVMGFLVVALITLAVGIVGYWGAVRLTTHLYEVGIVRLPSILGLELMKEAQTAIKAAERTLLIAGIEPTRIAHEHDQIKAAWERADKGWKIYEPLPQTQEEAAKWKQLVPAWGTWKKDHEQFIALFDEYQKTKDKANLEPAADQSLKIASTSFKVVEKLLAEIIDINIAVAEDAKRMATEDGSWAKIMSGVGTILGLVTALALGIGLALSISKPIKNVAGLLASGAEQTAAAASQVSSASQSLAEGASQQAASLEETSSSLEEMASMTKRNAEGADTAKDLAKQARAAAEQGSQSTQAMNQAVNSIQTSSEEMRAAMNAVKTSNDEVSNIIKTIDEIAFQTNILALNAAVEAARAGEAGMGFAVVADEVRNLAQKSAQAAQETSEKIEAAIARSEQGVRVCEKVNEQLKSVVVQARDVEEKLSGIFQKAQQVDALVAEIAAASREQSQGIDQVNKAVGEMDKVTQGNAANAEESASAAEELNAQADTLRDAVGDLLKLVEGQKVIPSPTTKANSVKKPKAEPKLVTVAPAKSTASLRGNGGGHRPQTTQSEPALEVPDRRKTIAMANDFTDF